MCKKARTTLSRNLNVWFKNHLYVFGKLPDGKIRFRIPSFGSDMEMFTWQLKIIEKSPRYLQPHHKAHSFRKLCLKVIMPPVEDLKVDAKEPAARSSIIGIIYPPPEVRSILLPKSLLSPASFQQAKLEWWTV